MLSEIGQEMQARISDFLQYFCQWFITSSTLDISFSVKVDVVSFNSMQRLWMVILGLWRWIYSRGNDIFRYRVFSYSSSISTFAVSFMGLMLLPLLSSISLIPCTLSFLIFSAQLIVSFYWLLCKCSSSAVCWMGINNYYIPSCMFPSYAFISHHHSFFFSPQFGCRCACVGWFVELFITMFDPSSWKDYAGLAKPLILQIRLPCAASGIIPLFCIISLFSSQYDNGVIQYAPLHLITSSHLAKRMYKM